MRIVVNHLTRMQPGYICVAGIDQATGQHVRPCLRDARLRTPLLVCHGGPFDIAAVVDLGETRHVGMAPETEDYLFDPRTAVRVGDVPPGEFWQALVALSASRLVDIFGRDLVRRGADRCAVDFGKGESSLGCLVPSGQPRLSLQGREGRGDQIRIRVCDGQFELDLPVTDIRLYGPDHVTPLPTLVQAIDARLARGVAVVLAVGLSRPYASAPDRPPLHWLQVNNVHLADDPGWRPKATPATPRAPDYRRHT